jgi:hypothetical protein
MSGTMALRTGILIGDRITNPMKQRAINPAPAIAGSQIVTDLDKYPATAPIIMMPEKNQGSKHVISNE